MGISRRSALKVLAGAAGTLVATALRAPDCAASAAAAKSEALAKAGGYDGMLYDATKCIGCKACMVACSEANDLVPDAGTSDNRWQMPLDLNARTKNIIKLYKDEPGGVYSFIKRQCMHCVDPACTTACMLGALKKREHGIVTYDADLCVGCRYCEMACPFGVPKFEWSSLAPLIVKCELCKHRIAEGKQPACTEVCPTHAVIYGTRDQLLADAHQRIREHPDLYIDHVYGEHEAGGTQVLYLSSVDFEKLGLPAYGPEAVPDTVRLVQDTALQGMAGPAVLYAMLAAVMLRNRAKGGSEESEESGEAGPSDKEDAS